MEDKRMSISLNQIVNIKTGKLDSNRAEEGGRYPFFTCAPDPLRIDEFAYNEDAILLAGNNANGVFHVNRYKGKFNAYQRTYIITARDPDKVSIDFIYYNLKTLGNMLESLSLGTATKFLTMKILAPFEIKLPSLGQQKAIAHILGTLDNKIQLNRQMNATLEAMAQALFKSWFVDFDPVIDKALAAGNPIPEPLRKRAEARQALGDKRKPLPADIEQHFPDRFVFNEEMGWVPEGWKVSTIGDEVETVGGGTPSTKDATFWEGGVHPFCTPKDMSALGSIVLMDTIRHLTDAGVNKISSGQLPKDVVLMSSRAPIGYLAISEVPVSVNQGVIAMLPNSKYGPIYLLLWAHFNMGAIKDRANGSTFLEINKKNFRPISFLVPTDEVTDFFNGQAKGIYNKMLLLSEQIRELSTLRDTLLPKLLSGQLRIPNAENFFKDA
ncbi:MAG: restriction endonuclease subunit S [Candidatus Electrothrix sp. AR5]|nr:restriction endonuclease subunit S [Candidatus Electrothrix sp. AR5]